MKVHYRPGGESMSSSQIFTIGTALRRAEDNNVPVEVLIEGQWIKGSIAALDGDGLVLVTPERVQCVVRNAHISVVRMLAALPDDDEDSAPQETTYESVDRDDHHGQQRREHGGQDRSALDFDATTMPAVETEHTTAFALEHEGHDVFVLDATDDETPLEIEAAHDQDPERVELPVAVVENPEPVEPPVAVVEEPEPVEPPVAVVEDPEPVEPPVAVVEDPEDPVKVPLTLVEDIEQDAHVESAGDERPRVFALPSPHATSVAPEPEPAPAPAAEAPTEADAESDTAAPAAKVPPSDWREMLSALRAEAQEKPASSETEAAATGPRRARRLVVR
jgi:hypothetical protein